MCFRHDGVVGVSTGLGGDLPRFLPGQIIIIHQHTHQLCDRYGRMGVVQLEGNLLIELMDIIMAFSCTSLQLPVRMRR